MTEPAQRPTWKWASQILGWSILVVLFGLFVAQSVTKRVHMDQATALAFLGIGCVLVGLPTGLNIAVSRGSQRRD